MQQIYLALKNVFKGRKYFLIFLIAAVIFFALFIAIPVITIPGNNISFQLSIFRPNDYFLMTFLAILAGLNLTFQIYAFKQQKTQKVSQSVAGGAISGVSGIFGAIVGTAFLRGAIALMLVLLYFSARKINKVCTSC